MSPTSGNITQEQARMLMSQLLDGELSPSDAARLDAFLKANPEATDWMESLELASPAEAALPGPAHREQSISSIRDSIAAASNRSGGRLLRFPSILQSFAAAAAIAVAGIVSWIGFNTSLSEHPGPNVVEFVTTEIPDASTFVYSDEESGWTVVWVESFEPLPAEHG